MNKIIQAAGLTLDTTGQADQDATDTSQVFVSQFPGFYDSG